MYLISLPKIWPACLLVSASRVLQPNLFWNFLQPNPRAYSWSKRFAKSFSDVLQQTVLCLGEIPCSNFQYKNILCVGLFKSPTKHASASPLVFSHSGNEKYTSVWSVKLDPSIILFWSIYYIYIYIILFWSWYPLSFGHWISEATRAFL
jgi:hypothetical protein